MIGSLLGLVGKVKTLTDRLTPARAGYLDNLNTNLAVLPAPASTALTTATWTNTKAGYLDAAISSVGAALVGVQTGTFSGARTGTGSGEDAAYWDVTVTAVVVAKCFCLVSDGWDTNATAIRIMTARLTSTTNLRIASPQAINNTIGRWYVIEFR